MADYHLCAHITDRVDGNYYLFPSVLMAKAEMTASDRITDMDPNLTLHRTFDADVRVGGVSVTFPLTLFRVLVCRLLARWGKTDVRTIACLKDGAHFVRGDAEVVLEQDPSFAFSAEIHAVNFGDVVRYQKELEVELGAVLRDNLKGATFVLGLRGFCCDGKDRSHFRSWDELGAFKEQTRKILCPRGRPKNIAELFEGEGAPRARVSLTQWLVEAPKRWATATCRADVAVHLETIRFFFDRAITAIKMAMDGTSANELSEGMFVVHSVTDTEPVLVLVASSGARKDADAVAFVKQLVVHVCLGEQQAHDPAQELEAKYWLEAADLVRSSFTSLDGLCRHPFFWDDAKQFKFVREVGNQMRILSEQPALQLLFRSQYAKVTSFVPPPNWPADWSVASLQTFLGDPANADVPIPTDWSCLPEAYLRVCNADKFCPGFCVSHRLKVVPQGCSVKDHQKQFSAGWVNITTKPFDHDCDDPKHKKDCDDPKHNKDRSKTCYCANQLLTIDGFLRTMRNVETHIPDGNIYWDLTTMKPAHRDKLLEMFGDSAGTSLRSVEVMRYFMCRRPHVPGELPDFLAKRSLVIDLMRLLKSTPPLCKVFFKDALHELGMI
jgi:hypothetical protein